MLDKLRELPRSTSLEKYLNELFKEKGNSIVSIILFGSMARGDYTKYSDYDLLIIISSDKLNFKDRLLEFSKFSDGWVEPLVYTEEEAAQMFRDFNVLILDALKDGIVIYDRGFWDKLKESFNALLRKGVIAPKACGWRIDLSKLI